MDILLSSLTRSLKHLDVLDRTFSCIDYPEKDLYLELKKEIRKIDDETPENRFSEEFYVGGKKRGPYGYSRPMILSDIFEFITNGRGYFYAVRSEANMKRYLKLILLLIDQLMIFDSITVNIELRKSLLTALCNELSGYFLKDADRKREHESLLIHDGPIGFPIKNPHIKDEVLKTLQVPDEDQAIGILDEYYDSLLPKTGGGLWGELLVYTYLLRRNLGYVFPLLLNQRLLSGRFDDNLKPPDFLLFTYAFSEKEKTRLLGIEVGAGKEIQTGDFSTITGIPTVTKANADLPKRCTLCGKWILFCPVVIDRFADLDFNIPDLHKPIKCLEECPNFKKEEILDGKCSYVMHKGGDLSNSIMLTKGNINKYHVHLICLLKDKQGKTSISTSKIITYYPYVTGLEKIEQISKSKKFYEEQIECLKKQIEILKKEAKIK